jgi:hypothetical protein
MGNTYGNVIVRADRAKVMGYLTYARKRAFVSDQEGPYVVVCAPDDVPRDLGWDFEPEDYLPFELAEELSDKLRCCAIAVHNDDNDRFAFQVWQEGQLLDDYQSPRSVVGDSDDQPDLQLDEWTPDSDRPGGSPPERWEEEDRSEGDASLLAKLFGISEHVARVRRVLNAGTEDEPRYLLSMNRHADLCALLGWPSGSVDASYRYIEQEERGGWRRVG